MMDFLPNTNFPLYFIIKSYAVKGFKNDSEKTYTYNIQFGEE